MITATQEIDCGDFSWSNSRHNAFDECKRKYFLQYYGSKADPELKRLKEMSALPLWGGNLVHDVMESYLKARNAPPTPDELDKLVHQVTHGQMPQDWLFSESATKKFRLFEHEYQIPVGREEKLTIIGLVASCIRNAMTGPIIAEAYAVGRKNWLSCEDLVSIDQDGTKTWIKMDFAYRAADGRVKIVDWKTGRTVGKFNSAQISNYALYAFRKGWAKDPSEIDTVLAYLAIPEYKVHKITWEDLNASKDFTNKSVLKMRGFISEKNTAKLEDFPMCGKEWTCKRCPFRRVCFPGWIGVNPPRAPGLSR